MAGDPMPVGARQQPVSCPGAVQAWQTQLSKRLFLLQIPVREDDLLFAYLLDTQVRKR